MTEQQTYMWVSVALMVVIIYVIRVLPFAFLQGHHMPDWFNDWLSYVPAAVFGALIFPDVFLSGGKLALGWDNLNLYATLVTFPVAYKTRSIALTILAGAAAYAALMLIHG